MNAVVCVMGLAELGRCPGTPVMAATVREQFLKENLGLGSFGQKWLKMKHRFSVGN